MTLQYSYWQDPKDGMWLGFWDDYPDYQTEGRTLDELRFMLRDIRALIDDGTLTNVQYSVGEMEYA